MVPINRRRLLPVGYDLHSLKERLSRHNIVALVRSSPSLDDPAFTKNQFAANHHPVANDQTADIPAANVGHATSSSRTITCRAGAGIRGRLCVVCGLLMAGFTLNWVVVVSPVPPSASLRETFKKGSTIVAFTCWLTSMTAFTILHYLHLAQSQPRRRHWSSQRPEDNFILRVVSTSCLMLLTLDYQAEQQITLQFALTYVPPIVSGAAWLNSLWGSAAGTLDMASGVSGDSGG